MQIKLINRSEIINNEVICENKDYRHKKLYGDSNCLALLHCQLSLLIPEVLLIFVHISLLSFYCCWVWESFVVQVSLIILSFHNIKKYV